MPGQRTTNVAPSFSIVAVWAPVLQRGRTTAPGSVHVGKALAKDRDDFAQPGVKGIGGLTTACDRPK